MQIVIEIDEEYYHFIKRQVAHGITNPLKTCVARGIQLPERHGRLIDAEILDLENLYRENDDCSFSMVYTKSEFPTIIEADTEE